MKIAFVIYAETESLFEKLHAYHDNPDKLSTTIVNKHTASGYSSFTQFSFDSKKNKHDYYRGKDCVKNFYKYLKEHLIKVTIFEILKILPLKERENKSNRKHKLCYLCKDKFNKNMEKNFCKVRDDFHHTEKVRGSAHLLCNLKYKSKYQILVVFQNGSNYDYHFIIKGFAKEFKGQFECLRKNTEKYINLSIPTEKVLENDKK